MASNQTVDFGGDKDEVLDDEMATEEPGRLKSTIVSEGKKTKGRGFRDTTDDTDKYGGKGGQFESMDTGGKGPVKSVEGYIVFASGLHEEASEEDVQDLFSDYGVVKSLNLPLDRRTGFVKGYVLVEYESQAEAEAAISNQNGKAFMDTPLQVDWAFSNGTAPQRGGRGDRRYSNRK
eukprot:TRINITY_DN19200_c0_g1_i1.p1 TRINITY_DN19200_c0_g1~~TRINITY_DN19200_c0_g1_i1.p1  ORF type:complete len:177 (+),score=49.53 TRINITY_DN19200_c0_g1_i1:72-602(+)